MRPVYHWQGRPKELTLGQAIFYARKDKCWSAQKLADEANQHVESQWDKITRSAIAQWETERTKIAEVKLRAIEAALGIRFGGPKLNDNPYVPHHRGEYCETDERSGVVSSRPITNNSRRRA